MLFLRNVKDFLPIVSGDAGEKVYAYSLRALYMQSHDINVAYKILQDMDLDELEKLSKERNWDLTEAIIDYFTALGMEKEIHILLQEDATKLIDVLEKERKYYYDRVS